MRDWTFGKVVWVADRSFTSAENRRHLMADGSGHMLGEKLRSGGPEAKASCPGRATRDPAGLLGIRQGYSGY
jgi:hypothetical protein